jgi:chromosome segregation ATPase
MESVIKVIEQDIDRVQQLIEHSERAKDRLRTLIEDLQKRQEVATEIEDLQRGIDDLSQNIKNAKDDIGRYQQQIQSLCPRK